jgi:hypothetical protein
MIDPLRLAGVPDPETLARALVAVVRRERAAELADAPRTWAPGEDIPADVMAVYDLDGYIWDRQSADLESGLAAAWRMQGFDPDEHESLAGGLLLTPALLEAYGPVTEVRKARAW